MKETQSHWERVYRTKAADQLSWYRPHLDRSLELIGQAAGLGAHIIDVGGGESTLVDDLLGAGYRNVSVLDISGAAIEQSQRRLAGRAALAHWRIADITEAELPAASYDVWHDRAVFHFLTEPGQRAAYVRQVMRALKPGGHVIVATFGPEGPEKCSGLEVVRYDAGALHGEFGREFHLIESRTELHATPFGTTQQFLYCYCRMTAASA